METNIITENKHTDRVCLEHLAGISNISVLCSLQSEHITVKSALLQDYPVYAGIQFYTFLSQSMFNLHS
jgi:hypothetical protein